MPRRPRSVIEIDARATRYGEFSTGAFVEPITRWEPDRRLDGYLQPVRGEFRCSAMR